MFWYIHDITSIPCGDDKKMKSLNNIFFDTEFKIMNKF